jgi:glyoxylase I family protein
MMCWLAFPAEHGPARNRQQEDNMLDQPQQAAKNTLTELPLRLHHQAYAVKDQEANRHFMEDILGIPLAATWCERVFRAEVGREVDYCHTFYEFADGGALAFFQFADDEAWEKNRAIMQEVGGSLHTAFKVTQEIFDELKQRLDAAKVPVRVINHGYCVSMYMKTPDDLKLEFTVDAPNAEAIAAMRRKDAHSELARWLAGDRRTNNGDRPH